MTTIQQAAEERYPYWLAPEDRDHPDADEWSGVDASWQNAEVEMQRRAFIAGAEWMREQAAQMEDEYRRILWIIANRNNGLVVSDAELAHVARLPGVTVERRPEIPGFAIRSIPTTKED